MNTYLIVCPLVFLAGLVDSIAGGGGLISLPAFLLAGLPAHHAIATNKLSSAIGTTVSTARFARSGYIKLKLALPCIVLSLTGSVTGASLSLSVSDALLKKIMIVVLPVVALTVFLERKQDLPEDGVPLTPRIYAISMIAAFLIGMYDGFYGPGTGTFLILVLTGIAKTDLHTATGTTKALNLTSNVAALVTFILHRQVIYPLGLTAGLFCIAGHYIGSGMVTRNGIKVIRPIILAVLALLFLKVLFE